MKSVLISIRPEWCEKIISGKKTIEVRKTRPKIDTPFKCYIYCTLPKRPYSDYFTVNSELIVGGGKVIGEFVCDCITFGDLLKLKGDFIKYIKEKSCLTDEQLEAYSQGKETYHWHISNLVIYDKPKELSEFLVECHGKDKDCRYCKDFHIATIDEPIPYCKLHNNMRLEKPPQNWRYVEG